MRLLSDSEVRLAIDAPIYDDVIVRELPWGYIPNPSTLRQLYRKLLLHPLISMGISPCASNPTDTLHAGRVLGWQTLA